MYKKKRFHILYVKWNIISFTYNGRTNEQFLLPWKFILLKKKKNLLLHPVLYREK